MDALNQTELMGHYTLYHNEPILLLSKLPRSRRRALQEIMIPEI
jgi:hypothetical protein